YDGEQQCSAQPPTSIDEQIVPRSQWLTIEKAPIKALAITPVNPTHPFELPPSGDTVIDFVNELGYPEPVEITSGVKTQTPSLQMLWGIVTQTNVDHAELIWEEFTQGIQTFFSHKASHKASLKNPKKKVTPLLIPYGRFSKVIIYYLASNNNIHRRPNSAVHHTGDDYVLGNLKFVPKGESVEVFGMAIPDPLITEAIQQSSYYPKYLKMVAENTKKTPQGSASMQPATKRATPKAYITHQSNKHAGSSSDKKLSKHLFSKRRMYDPDLELSKKLSWKISRKREEGEGDDADLTRLSSIALDRPFCHKKKRTTDQFILLRRDQTPPDSTTGPSSQPNDDTSDKEIHESSSTSDSERTESETEDPEKAHEALAGPDPEPMKEDQTGSDSGKLHVSLAGPNPEQMDDEFLAQPTKVTSTPPVIAPFIDVSSLKPSLLVTPPPINTEATTITTSLPEITPFIALAKLQRLEQEMSAVKKTDLFADVLASIRSQVPTAVDNYLGTKLDDALLKSANHRNTAKLPLYHALMEDLIADENAIDKEVADKVKDHKRKHDSDDDEDDDDDEGPS
ncbi:hypothetical protein Tco_0963478, partial [Tanacetum coccineum]